MPAEHPLCRKRVHDWGPGGAQPGAVCQRPGCGHQFGKRGRAPLAPVSAPPPAIAPRPVLVHSQPGPTAPRPPGGLGGAAARLAAARGLQVLPNTQNGQKREGQDGSPGASADTGSGGAALAQGAASPKSDRVSFMERILPELPDAFVALAGFAIKRAGRIPNEPDPDWMDHFREDYQRCGKAWLPKIELSPGWALVASSAMVVVSMAWNSEKVITKEEKPKTEPSPKAGELLTSEVKECPTDAPAPSPAASPASADGSGDPLTSTNPLYSSDLPEPSGEDGSATNAKQAA